MQLKNITFFSFQRPTITTKEQEHIVKKINKEQEEKKIREEKRIRGGRGKKKKSGKGGKS